MSSERASPGPPTDVSDGVEPGRVDQARPDQDRTDRELIAAHVAGDADAFGELFHRHRDRLWAVALRTLGNPEDAADALQDAMVSAFRRAASYRGEAAVTTWLHRVVVNACLDRVRREAVRATDPLPEGDHSDRLGAARDDIAIHQQSLDVAAALATLPFEQRASLVLVDMEGYSVEDAAAVLGVAPGTIKSRCARGRARLLPLVAHLRGDGSGGGGATSASSASSASSGSSGSSATGSTGRAGSAGGVTSARTEATVDNDVGPGSRSGNEPVVPARNQSPGGHVAPGTGEPPGSPRAASPHQPAAPPRPHPSTQPDAAEGGGPA